jgi:aldose 1-epimerase
VDERNLPTGDIVNVEGSRFDLRVPTKIGASVFDHNFCLSDNSLATKLSYNGISVQIKTDAPGLQVYDAEHLGRTALALEPQGWPDAVNQVGFPSQIARNGALWTRRVNLSFSSFPINASHN